MALNLQNKLFISKFLNYSRNYKGKEEKKKGGAIVAYDVDWNYIYVDYSCEEYRFVVTFCLNSF
jgi:hypothetical protein